MAAASAASTASRQIPCPGGAWSFVSGLVSGLKENKPYKFLREWHNEHGPVLRIKTPVYQAVSLADPSLIKYVTRNDPARFTKGFGYESIQRGWLDNSLVVSEGEDWRRKRSIYNLAFKLGAIRSYVPLFVEVAEAQAKHWHELHKEGKPVDAVEAFERVALEAIGRAGFGMEGLGAPGHPYAKAFVSYLAILQDEIAKPGMMLLPRPLRRFVTKTRGAADLQTMTAEASRIALGATSASGESTRQNLVALMREATEADGSKLDPEQLAKEANLFLFAGHDTTSSTLAWIWAMFAQHPEVQQKAFEEVAAVPDDGLVDALSDPRNFPYLGNVIRETLRLFPPAALVNRAPINDEELGGFFIPKKTDLMLGIWWVQRDPTAFDDPDRFDPDRWNLPEGEKLKRMQDHWMPFMIGARSCIGQQFSTMEMRVLVSVLLRRFKAEPASSPQLVQRLLTLPSNIKLRCTPRS